MSRKKLVVAALLLTALARMGLAHAADTPEHQSNNARKLLATLDLVGINSQDVKELIAEADSHADANYLYLTDRKVASGVLSLRYQLGDGVGAKNLQLSYQPSPDSHFEYTAQSRGVMVNYTLHFQ